MPKREDTTMEPTGKHNEQLEDDELETVSGGVNNRN